MCFDGILFHIHYSRRIDQHGFKWTRLPLRIYLRHDGLAVDHGLRSFILGWWYTPKHSKEST